MDNIYGREKVRYSWSATGQTDSIQADTLDWKIEDTLLDGSNNDTVLTDVANDGTVDKIYESKGNKHVETIVDFDDGWGNIYQQTTTLTVQAVPYDAPELDLTWTPQEPTILEEVTFTQDHNDTRDSNNHFGEIQEVNVDFYSDDSYEYEHLADDDQFTHTFSPKEDDIPIKLSVIWNNGWENLTKEQTWYLDMSNIPPVSDCDKDELSNCIPKYKWTATSTDEDDDVSELTYEWILEQKVGDNWNLVEDGDEEEFEYPFQYEGHYRITLITRDDDNGEDTKQEEFDITFANCSLDGISGTGKVLIQPNRWQMVAVPVNKKVKDYFCDRLGNIANQAPEDLIELVKSFPSSDESHGKYLIYVPGLTNPDSSGNFNLMTPDNNIKEINAFLLKTKDFGTDPIEYTWDVSDGD